MKKRYLFIDGQLNAGGAERVLLDIFNNYDYRHNEVTLLQIVGGGTLAEQIPSQVRVVKAWNDYDISYKIATRLAIKLGIISYWRRRMLKALGNSRFDVAISFLEGMPLKAHSLITDVAERNYSWVHCDLLRDSDEVAMFRSQSDELKCYNLMSSVICVSEYCKQSFLNRFPNCKTNVYVIHNPIDIRKIELLSNEKKIENNIFTICVCGRLVKQKRVDRTINLAQNLKCLNYDFKIQIVGNGELYEELKKLIADKALQEYFEFVGYQGNPYPYIKSADILLSVSDCEGFGLVICEAMALSTVVISTKTAGPSEIIEDDINGILCDFTDESILKAITEIISNKTKYNRLRLQGAKRVAVFSVNKSLEKIYQL